MSRIVINDLTREDSQMLFDLTEEELQLIEGGIAPFLIGLIVLGGALLVTFVAGAINGYRAYG